MQVSVHIVIICMGPCVRRGEWSFGMGKVGREGQRLIDYRGRYK